MQEGGTQGLRQGQKGVTISLKKDLDQMLFLSYLFYTPQLGVI